MNYFKCCLNCVAPKRYPGCSIKCKEYAEEKGRYESDKARARKCYIPDIYFIDRNKKAKAKFEKRRKKRGNKSYTYGDS